MNNNNLDMKKMEKAAYDVHNVSALIGCLVKAVHDQENDFAFTKMTEVFCWQIRGALEIAYDILDNASSVFFEANEIMEQMNKRDTDE